MSSDCLRLFAVIPMLALMTCDTFPRGTYFEISSRSSRPDFSCEFDEARGCLQTDRVKASLRVLPIRGSVFVPSGVRSRSFPASSPVHGSQTVEAALDACSFFFLLLLSRTKTSSFPSLRVTAPGLTTVGMMPGLYNRRDRPRSNAFQSGECMQAFRQLVPDARTNCI